MIGSRQLIDRLALGGVAAFSLLVHLALYRYPFDDAFIHLRVAENLATLGAPYYNPAEAVMASSSPAWTLLLAALVKLGAGTQAIALLNAAVTTAGALVWCRLLGKLAGRAPHPAAAWSFAVPYVSLVHHASIGLMETPLAVLVAGLGLLAVVDGRSRGFLLLALAVFLRLECAVILVAVGAWNLWTKTASRSGSLLWTASAALPFIAYELVFFGTLLPATVSAKRRVYELRPLEMLEFWTSGIVPPMPWGRSLAWSLPPLILAAALTLWWVTDGIRAARLGEARSQLVLAVLAAGLVVGGAYAASGVLIFPWYVPLYGVPLAFGVFALALQARRRRGVLVLLAIALLLPHGVEIARSAAAIVGLPSVYRHFDENARVRKYQEVGRRLHESYPEARLMSAEIGGLGHGFRGTVVDGVGLITPRALDHHPMEIAVQRSTGVLGAVPLGLVTEMRPELVVGIDIFLEAFLSSEVRRDYLHVTEAIYSEDDLERVGSPTLWNSRAMNVFVRRDLAASDRPRRKLCFDEAHANVHTVAGGYAEFVRLAQREGFVIAPLSSRWTELSLASCQVVVAVSPRGATRETTLAERGRPAFEGSEVAALLEWLTAGRGVLFVTDHPPIGAAAEPLAAGLRIDMSHGFVEDPEHFEEPGGYLSFSRANGLLAPHPITDGASPAERVEQVAAFLGQSLKGPPGAVSLLTLGAGAWDRHRRSTDRVWLEPGPGDRLEPAGGRSQALAYSIGSGRVVALGDAAMLASLGRSSGLEVADVDNRLLAVNILRWLVGDL